MQQVKDRLHKSKPGLWFLGVALLLSLAACRWSAELPISSTPPSSPVASEQIVATSVTSLAPSSTPIFNQAPSVTTAPTLAEPVVLTPTPIVTRLVNTPPDVAPLEPLKSGGMARIDISPMQVELMLTDAQGRRLGYDPGSGQEINEFADGQTNSSSYTHYSGIEGVDNSSNTILLAPLQAWGTTITFTITGLESDNYKLVGVINDGYLDSFPRFIFSDTISAGEIQTKTIYIPPTVLAFATPPQVQAGPDLTATVGELITFTGSFTDTNQGDTHQISWDFGDGSIAQDTLTPSHTYTTSGIYTATLTVAEGFGYVKDTLQVTVK